MSHMWTYIDHNDPFVDCRSAIFNNQQRYGRYPPDMAVVDGHARGAPEKPRNSRDAGLVPWMICRKATTVCAKPTVACNGGCY